MDYNMVGPIHKSYTAGFKLTVVAKAEKVGNRAAAREFNVNEKCVRRWRRDKGDLERMPEFKRAQRGGIAAWPDLETELEMWIKIHQSKALSMLEIREKAKLIAGQMGLENFKGTINWYYRFLRRKQLLLNSKTVKLGLKKDWNTQESYLNRTNADFKLTVINRAKKIGNKAAAQEFDVGECCVEKWRLKIEDLEKKAVKHDSENNQSEKISSFVKSVMLTTQTQNLTNMQIINVGEIPFSFHFMNNKNGKAVPVLTASSEKLSFTCVISCAANGDKLKPFLIFKRKSIPEGNYPADVVIRISEGGDMCKNLVLDWLHEIWCKRKGDSSNPQGILVLDAMQGQLFESVKSKYEKLSMSLAVIPEGLKKLLHPVDFLIGKTFEKEMMKCYGKWMNSSSHSFTKGGKMRKAVPEEIAKWVFESWRLVEVSTITNGFMQAGIVSSVDSMHTNRINLLEITESNDNECQEIKRENIDTCDHDCVEIEDDEFLTYLFLSDTDESDSEEFG